jgi:sugar phosphate isomerase/epimerase
MMPERIARRQFLKTVGAGALTGMATDLLASPVAKAASGDGNSSKMSRLFAGCCAYSYGKELKGGEMTLEDLIQKAVEFQIDSVDMTTYYLKSVDLAYLYSLRHLAYHNAVVFSGVACGVNMAEPDPIKRTQNVSEIKKWVDVTDQLGASHLRVFAGKLPPGANMQQSIDWVVETMKAGCDYSAQRGIMLGMEDHPGVAETAGVCLEVMHRVNSPYAGINLDITHFVPTATEDAYAQIAACIPYATHVHIRDRFDDQTPIDLDRVWQLFAHAGFKGYMSAEYDSRFAEDVESRTAIPKLIVKIRALCKKYSDT